MFALNRVHLIGYQTQPVSVRQTPGGTSVVDLNLVVPYSFKSDQGDMLTGKSFHTVTAWGPMAEVAGQFLRPGGQVFIGGRLQTDSWQDESTGEKRSKTKIVAAEMILLDPKNGQLAVPAGAKMLLGSCNRAEIVGNVTRDPEMRTTTSGQKVVTLGVATNDRWKDRATGEQKEKSEFHNVVIWGDLAQEVSQVIKKGYRVYVAGRIQTRAWETQSGAKRTTTEVVAETVTLLGVRSVVAEEAVSASEGMAGAPRAERTKTPRAQEEGAPVGAGVPEIHYESEIKVEDLPF